MMMGKATSKTRAFMASPQADRIVRRCYCQLVPARASEYRPIAGLGGDVESLHGRAALFGTSLPEPDGQFVDGSQSTQAKGSRPIADHARLTGGSREPGLR